jgi:2-keto-4-pentenoate hydratase/2-oxohepta-3-ene-1,7-dioic acid hydratase in catechol pathway
MSPTRLIRFIAVEDSRTYVGAPILPPDLDVAQYVAASDRSPLTARVLPSDNILDASLAPTDQLRTVARLLPILPPARIPSIRALGANYVQPGQEAREARAKRPALPILFFKPPQSCVVGHGDAIVVPKEMEHETDYEVELVVVIGRDCKDVQVHEALSYVRGYALGNDVSARKRMFAVPQWGLGEFVGCL